MKRNQTLGQLSVGSKYFNKENNETLGCEISGITYQSKSKKKFEDLAYVTNSFLSLNNLEKEM